MQLATNFGIFILAVVPALIYLFLIFLMGRKTISLKKTIAYILFGCLSVMILEYGLHFIFPHILDYQFLNEDAPIYNLTKMRTQYEPTILSILFLCFVQVGLKEELTKMSSFVLASSLFSIEKHKNSLFAIMFYSCCTAVGFAVIENIHYAQEWLRKSTQLETQLMIIQRSVFSVLCHMTAGLIMGYGLAMASTTKSIRKACFLISTVLAAVLYHGYFNFSLMTSTAADFVTIGIVHIHIKVAVFMVLSLIATFLLGLSLRSYSKRYSKVLRKKMKLNQEE